MDNATAKQTCERGMEDVEPSNEQQLEMSDEEMDARIRRLELPEVFIALANKLQQVASSDAHEETQSVLVGLSDELQQAASSDAHEDTETVNLGLSAEMTPRERALADYKAGVENVFKKLIEENKCPLIGINKAKEIYAKSLKNIKSHPKYTGASE